MVAVDLEAKLWHFYAALSFSGTVLVQTPGLVSEVTLTSPPNGTGPGLLGLLSAVGVGLCPGLLFFLSRTPFPQLFHDWF